MPPSRRLQLCAILLIAFTIFLTLSFRLGLVNAVHMKKLVYHGTMWAPGEMTPLKSSHSIVAHLFREDGIVEVNPDAEHPVFELMDRAEARWQAKLDSASRTLEEAVTEYIRRYKRDPPKGFDAWRVLFLSFRSPILLTTITGGAMFNYTTFNWQTSTI